MRKVAAVSGAALCLLAGLAICSQDVPWPCFRHDAQNSGRADHIGADVSALIAVLLPNQAPAVWASTDVVEGPASLLVNMAAAGSDPENGPLTYACDFGDGSTGSDNREEWGKNWLAHN